MRTLILSVICTLAVAVCALAAAVCTPAEESSIRSFFDSYRAQWSLHNIDKISEFYSDEFIDADKLTKKDVLSLLKDFFGSYPDVTATDTITSIKVAGDVATVTHRLSSIGHASSTGMFGKEPGEMHGTAEVVSQLRRSGDTWKLVGEHKLVEQVTVDYGTGKELKATLEVPSSVKPGQKYLASFETSPAPFILMGSIYSRPVKFPADEPKDAWRSIQNRKLQREIIANQDGRNERVEATAGLIDPTEQKMTGLKHLIKLVNVAP